MTAKKLTFEEYYVLEQADPWKNELCGGEMIPLDHTGWQHNVIIPRLIGGIGEWLKDTRFCSLSSRMRVYFPETGLYTYPDVLILPRPVESTDARHDTILNPHVVIEVLTTASEARVRRTMHRHYMRASSVREVLLVADDEPRVEHYVRSGDCSWTFRLYSDLSESFSLHTVRAEMPLADIYRHLESPADPVILSPR